MCENAALGGHLDALQWARMNECLWDAVTCAEAAYCGHLDILQRARANGCPWSHPVWVVCKLHAEQKQHHDMVAWLNKITV